MREHYTSVQ